MLTAPLRKSAFYYNYIGSQMFAGLGKKVFAGDNYFGRRNYYKAILSQYANFSSYTSILNDTISLNSIPSTIDIQSGILGANTKAVLTKYGKPVFVFNQGKVTIFIYKWKFNRLKTSCEIHFYDQTVFLVNYNYHPITNNEKSFVIKTIAQKYTGTDGELDIRNCKIIDKNSNLLGVSDFFGGLKVTYLSAKDSGWYLNLTSDIDKKIEKLNTKARVAEQLFYKNI